VYAVIEAGGKQLRVEPGQIVEVDSLPQPAGSEISFGRVLMLVDGAQVNVGTPTVPGARVAATVLAHRLGRKVIVGKLRPKKHYRRRVGHRQPLSRVRVDRIELEESSHGA
jgi:large subunit ribosomal protein L21